ncbi:hypothetical protein BVX98_02565 [bacterium F11]|nr:hypothetical protein BVX98_02565 [bacterium F11]
MKIIKRFPKNPFFLIFLLTLGAFLPFIGKPLFVDDHPVYQEALDLPNHPAKPYITIETRPGWDKGTIPNEYNPPFYFYYMGYLAKLVGNEIWKAHLFILPFTLLGLWAFYWISRSYLKHPLLATAFLLISPHFWITGTSLLVDALLAPMMLMGIACWIEAWKRQDRSLFLLAGVLLGLAPLVKYTGLLSWAVVVLWSLGQKPRKQWTSFLFLLIPFLMMASWLTWTRLLYQESHFSAVAHQSLHWPTVQHLVFSFAYASASTFVVCLLLLFLKRLPNLERWPLVLIIYLGGWFAGLSLNLRPTEGIQMGFWVSSFCLWLMLVTPQSRKEVTAKGWLWGWVLLGLLGLSLARDLYCGRYFVIIGPPMIILTLQLLEEKFSPIFQSRQLRYLLFTGIFIPSLLLTMGDYGQAKLVRRAANDLNLWLKKENITGKAYYTAATLESLGFYLDSNWNPMGPQESMNPGDVVVLPLATLPSRFFPKLRNPVLVGKFLYQMKNPFRTISRFAHAGFYGSIWEPLPFSVTQKPAGVYTVIQEQ